MRPIDTTEEYYKELTISIRRAWTTILDPDQFNALINLAELDYVTGKLPEREFNQKRIDDLSVLRVLTDGESICYHGFVVYPIPSTAVTIFPVPRRRSSFYDATTGYCKIGNQNYPVYLSGSRVSFKVNEIWIEGSILPPDEKGNILKSTFRKPSVERLYFEHSGQFIKGYFPVNTVINSMLLEYYTYPRMVFYDEQSPADNSANVNHTPGQGSINSIFEENQKREIIDIATRTFLEITESPRYKSMLNEFAIKSRNK